jgi:hypothetical protein
MTTEEEADDRAACEIESACRTTVRLASEGHYWIFIFGSAPTLMVKV